jgi:sterol 14-demethylase
VAALATRRRVRRTPPGPPGLPLVGNLLEYRRDHVDVFWKAYREHGPVFSIRLGPQRAAVLIGPERHRFFFEQVDKTLSLPEVYRFVIPMFGPVLNAATERAVRKKQLQLLHSAFRGERMDRHVDVMVAETEEWLDTLGERGTFDMNDAFATLGMNIAASAFMGPRIRSNMGEFLPLYEDLARGMEFVLPPNLPLPRFIRRDRARVRLGELIRPAIEERRAHPDEYGDFLETIVGGDYLDGISDPDDTVVGLALLSVFTAYITTAAQMSWALVQLLQNPGWLALVRSETDSVGIAGAPPDRDALRALERLDWSLKETQRMHPVMSHYARHTAQSYEMDGYVVPEGWMTMLCPAIAHRLPDVFDHPDLYEPERFAPDRSEHRRIDYSLIGFGAGLYKCPGMAFGTAEMQCVLSMLLARYDVALATPSPVRDYAMGVIRPGPECRVSYTRRRPVGKAASHKKIAGNSGVTVSRRRIEDGGVHSGH